MDAWNGVKIGLFVAAALANACGGGDSGSGGTGGGAGSGQSGSSGSGAGNSGASAGGSSGAQGCGDVEAFGADDIDVTLGGLNADLPAPSTDCLTADPASAMCAAFSAIVNGSAREIVCSSPSSAAIDGASLSCDTSSGENVAIVTSNFGGMSAPATFTVTQTEQMFFGPISLSLGEGSFSANGDTFVEARLAGWVNKFEPSGRCMNTVFGVAAASWSDGGSGETRVRGTFHAREF